MAFKLLPSAHYFRQEADRLRAAHPAGRELPVQVLDLAEFDLHLDLVPVNSLREELDIDVLLMSPCTICISRLKCLRSSLSALQGENGTLAA
jgi:hypothetical protein